MSRGWIDREALIIVKAYPNPSAKYHETVCVAAITKEEGLIRLYPVQFRSMSQEKRFKKYQRVRLRIAKHEQDRRPESYRLDEDSIKLLDIKETWAARWAWIEPVVSQSLCEIQREQASTGKSLGVFRPKRVLALEIEAESARWAARKQTALDQMSLFDPATTKLEKIPFVFRYKYVCCDSACKGHTQSIIDWELMELYRKVRDRASAVQQIEGKIHAKYFDEICGPTKDTHFYVGNHSRFPASFMILGAYWPPKPRGVLFGS